MIYQGSAIQVSRLESGIARLCFDQPAASVNVFNRAMLAELRDALAAVTSSGARGLILVSAKSTFVVGADIKEFTELFKSGPAALMSWLRDANDIFNTLEDLAIPTGAAVNGMALGGGLEVCLATDFRALSEDA